MSEGKENKYEFNVQMTCGGCSGAVERVLKKAKETDGVVSEYDVNLGKKTVTVTGILSYEDALARISKTGKKVLSGKVVVPEVDKAEAPGDIPELKAEEANTDSPKPSVETADGDLKAQVIV